MSYGLATSVVLALFLAVTSVVFLFLINSWTDHSIDTALALNRQLERVESGDKHRFRQRKRRDVHFLHGPG